MSEEEKLGKGVRILAVVLPIFFLIALSVFVLLKMREEEQERTPDAITPPPVVKENIPPETAGQPEAPSVTVNKKPVNVVDRAISDALRWLAKKQKKDGSWDAAIESSKTGVTALALLAFIENGHSTRDGVYCGWVSNGLNYLLSRQSEKGTIDRGISESWIYNHVISLIVFSKIYGMTGEKRFRDAAGKAAQYLISAQNPGLGWKYQPKSGRNDTSITSWAVLAFHELRSNKVMAVPESVFDGAWNWFDRATNTAGKTGYMRPGDDGSVIRGVNEQYSKNPSLTAAAIFSRILCGQSRNDPKIIKGLNIVKGNFPEWQDGEKKNIDLYCSFWLTNALKTLVPPQTMKDYASHLIVSILSLQEKEGRERGSFSPDGKWGMVGGRAYSTAICAIVLKKLKDVEGVDLSSIKPLDKILKDEEEADSYTGIPPNLSEISLSEITSKLNHLKITISFSETPLLEVFNFLHDITRIFCIPSKELCDNASLYSITLRLRDVSLKAAIEAICLSAGGIDYGIREENGSCFVYLSSPDDIANLNLPKPADFKPSTEYSSIKAALPNRDLSFGLSKEEYRKVECIRSKFDEKVKLSMEISTFGELRRLLKNELGIEIKLSESALKNMPDDDKDVSRSSDERTLEEILNALQYHAQAKYVITPNGILFPSEEMYRNMEYLYNKSHIESVLKTRTVTLSFKETSFENLISFLSDITGLNFVFTAKARKTCEEKCIDRELSDSLLLNALEDICRRAGVTYEIKEYYILIKSLSE